MTNLDRAPSTEELGALSCPFCPTSVSGSALAPAEQIQTFEAHLDEHFADGTANLERPRQGVDYVAAGRRPRPGQAAR